MKRTKFDRRGFVKAVFFGVSAIVAGIAVGCGGQQTSNNEPNSQPTGVGQNPEDQDSNDGSNSRDNGSGSR